MKQPILQDRDGFQAWEGNFSIPEETWKLDPQSKRAVTICNLFANHHYGISDIVRVLEEERRNVIQVLLKQGIIKDRRERQARLLNVIERRKPVFNPKVTLRTA